MEAIGSVGHGMAILRRAATVIWPLLCAAPLAAQNYNQDTFMDLVVGVPSENPAGLASDAGTVHVIYGSDAGLSADAARTDQLLYQGLDGIEGVPEVGDRFGFALARGDFDRNGIGDLAVGVPGDRGQRGSVHVFYGRVLAGGEKGLDLANDQYVRDGIEVPGAGLPFDFFGYSLAAGDFDGDLADDLAIGVIGHAAGNPSVPGAGRVFVLWGASQIGLGLGDGRRVNWLDQDVGSDDPENGDGFGSALLAADFGGDGHDDLVVGVPHESLGFDGSDHGAVHVFSGNFFTGFSPVGRFITQGEAGDWIEPDDFFGQSLAAGDFDDNGLLDLVLGAPREDLGDGPVPVGHARPVPVEDAGAVSVLYGSALGLGLDPDLPPLFVNQSTFGVPTNPRDGELFGYALAAGNFRHSFFDDLAIGVPGEDRPGAGTDDIGIVHVLLGSADGLTTADGQYLQQGRHGLAEFPGAGDAFGAALAVGQFDGDLNDDLAVGVPGEDLAASGDEQAGLVHVIYGHGGGLDNPVQSELWTQDSAGIEGGAEDDDGFGAAVLGR